MIKTVSFAPPRGSGSRTSSKSHAKVGAQIGSQTNAKVVSVETLRPQARAASGSPTKMPAKSPKPTAQTSLELLFDAPDEPEIAAPVVSTPVIAPKVAKKSVKTAPNPMASKGAATTTPPEARIETKAVAAPIPVPVAPTPAPKAAEIKKGELKAKRVRVPKDLAAQYGEKTVVRVAAAPVEAEIVKKRLTKSERLARHELIKPSEDLIARLARLNEIGARKPKTEPRGKGWKFVCGRCGITSYFETPGGLCSCGTIAIKEN